MPTPERIDLTADCRGMVLNRSYTVESFPATNHPLTHEVLVKVFGKTGQLPLSLGRLDCGALPPVVLPLSHLNAIRREFYKDLSKLLEERRHQARNDHRRQAMAELVPMGSPALDPPCLSVVLGNIYDLALLKKSAINELVLPLSPGACVKIENGGRAAFKTPERILWNLPLAIFDSDWPAYQVEVDQLIKHGFYRFRLQNLGQLMLFVNCEGLALECGYRLFTTNSQAAAAWHELGFTAATLYVEDDRDNIAAILSRNNALQLAVTVYANVPMMTSRIPLRGIKPEYPLVSDRDESYRVDDRSGMTVIRPELDFSLIGHLGEMRKMGCSRFVVDLSHLATSSADARRVLAAFAQDEPLPGTSTFNYLQEMI
jgi:putative protease